MTIGFATGSCIAGVVVLILSIFTLMVPMEFGESGRRLSTDQWLAPLRRSINHALVMGFLACLVNVVMAFVLISYSNTMDGKEPAGAAGNVAVLTVVVASLIVIGHILNRWKALMSINGSDT